MAYSSGTRPPGAPAPHPGEGTRAAGPPPEGPIPLRPQARSAPPVIGATADDDEEPDEPPMIGAVRPGQTVRRTLPEDVVPPIQPGHSPRRYTPPPGEPMPRKPMPQIYERNRLLSYWYIPVAIALAVVVALGVILGAEWLLGGDDDPQPAATETPDGDATPASPAQTTTTAPTTVTPGTPSNETPAATGTPGSGVFQAGDSVTVFNTGDCLNVRTAPGVNDPETGELNPAIICIADGTRVTITDGPEEAGSFTWWKVETVVGEGWAVQDYLQRGE